jgi:outer membrane protein assembly factor BamB
MRRISGMMCTGVLAIVALASSSAAEEGPIWAFRGDGSGAFRDATPVTEWAPDKNVIWKTPLPGWTNASPIIVGNKVFTCVEKDTLVCINKADGTILWSRPNDFKGIFTPEEWAVVQKRRADLAAITKSRDDAQKRLNDVTRLIQFSTQAARDKNEEALRKNFDRQIETWLKQAADADLKAELNTQEARDRHAAARKADYEAQADAAKREGKALPPYAPLDYGPIPTENQVAQFKKQAADFRARADKQKTAGYKPTDYGPIPSAEEVALMKQEQANLKAGIAQYNQDMKPFADIAEPSVNGVTGYTTPTPVTDGTHVYVLFATGVAACYDLEGNRKWAVNVGPSPDTYGQAASPVLVGDKLILHVERVKALDKATGKPVWQSDVVGPKYGTPVRTTLAGQDVVLTANGAIVRVGDGKVLATGLGNLDGGSPIVDNGVAYYLNIKTAATQLPLSDSDTAPRRVWTGAIASARYYASSVVAKGVVYAIMESSVATAVDIANGKKLWEKKLPLGQGIPYPSITAAGDYVFISNENGQTLVIKAGPEYQEVAHNTLEPFRSSPVFEGKRMYLRTLKHLHCIGKE